ncbi:MAG TPA: MBL fold metallo-hydrolase [Anaerolineales bacterium]|jgi:glyoxylase-like metal-dependent hydrolase (beta-lactamase superfamily II)|nr:MBL fold metallo-hydrolase [Anaerolineales bacterium]
MPADQDNHEVKSFRTSAGGRIYQIPVEVFPGFWASTYLVLVDGEEGKPLRALIDTGSGFGQSNEYLDDGLMRAAELSGQSISLENLTHVLITHGHIDHFGGLAYVRPRTPALLGVHELDRRNLTNYEERLTIVARRLNLFFIEAGVSEHLREGLLDMYKLTKGLFRSVAVDFTYEAVKMRVGPFQILHVPGHCAGHVVIRLHDVLFSGDHILQGISPHQAPEHLTLSTGLSHYLQSLDALEHWAEGINLTLGGHKDPVTDLPARLRDIRELHETRLSQVLDLLAESHTVSEVSKSLFGEVQGYNVLLALEEAGAHVEYLYQRGLLGIENLSELEDEDFPIAIRYRRL